MEQFVPAGRSLSVCRRLCDAVGHFLNDLCGAMWCAYLPVYRHSVIGFHSTDAGVMMLIGQIADGVFSPGGLWMRQNSVRLRQEESLAPLWHAFTVVANVTVYTVAWLLFNFQSQHNVDPSIPDSLGRVDTPLFRTLTLILLGTGTLFSLIFHVSTKEDMSASESEIQLITPSPLMLCLVLCFSGSISYIFA